MGPVDFPKKRTPSDISLYVKCGVLLLFLLITSISIIACSSTGSNSPNSAANLNAPPVTITIQFDNGTTALPTQAPYLCGAWITNTSPAFIPNTTIPVYAKFIHLTNGNPQGMSGATAQAVVHFADGSTVPLPATTTGSDGLAVFSFKLPNKQIIAGHNNVVTVTFSGANGTSCSLDTNHGAYFTPLLVTPTVTPTPTPPTNTKPPKKRRPLALVWPYTYRGTLARPELDELAKYFHILGWPFMEVRRRTSTFTALSYKTYTIHRQI